MALIRVAKASEFSGGSIKSVILGSRAIAVTSVGGKFYAFQNPCSHMGGHLSEGMMLGNVVICPLHGCQFDITTGEHLSGPSNKPIKTYPVKVVGEDVFVELED